MMILAIAWKNVWRNKLRSLVVIIAVTLGLFGGIFTLGIMNGMQEQLVNSSIETEISNIQIHNPKFLANNEVKFTIKDVIPKLVYIANLPQVKAASKRIKATAMASTAITGTGVLINGIIPEQEKRVTNLWTKIIKGNYFETKTRVPPTVIGEKLASKLKAKVNSKIVITIQDMTGIITYGAFRVVGIYRTQDSNFDERMIFVKNEDILNLIGLAPSQTSEIAILLNNNSETDEVTAKLKHKFPNLDVQSWKTIQPSLIMMTVLMQQMSYLFLAIILIALAFAIINTMLMVVMERMREIGMLMAIGMNKAKIFGMIMVETIFLSIVGGIVGIIISAVTISYFGQYGINFAIVSKGLSSLGYASIAYPIVSAKFYFIIAIMVVITAIISSFYP
ncbi:MAG: FtsX-like permease family protein, partial [Candidatus Cloacimonadota bacterium]|nr:FtsX-like permease family protein [Candidatus Cloacimonadota bacterium]